MGAAMRIVEKAGEGNLTMEIESLELSQVDGRMLCLRYLRSDPKEFGLDMIPEKADLWIGSDAEEAELSQSKLLYEVKLRTPNGISPPGFESK